LPITTYVKTSSSGGSSGGGLTCYSFGWPKSTVALGAVTDLAIAPASSNVQTFTSWQAVALTAPTSSPDIFDVRKNGVSIFGASPPINPYIPAGVTSVQTGTTFGSSVTPHTFTDLYVQGLGYLVGSLTYTFTSLDIGQSLTITSGTGFFPGTYPIIGLQIGTSGLPTGIAILNLACAVASSTGGHGTESGTATASVSIAAGDVLQGVIIAVGSPPGQSEKLQVYAQ
jgi:hypothetical protein